MVSILEGYAGLKEKCMHESNPWSLIPNLLIVIDLAFASGPPDRPDTGEVSLYDTPTLLMRR